MVKTHYDATRILGVPHQASLDEIKTAYKKLVKIYHPDSGFYSNQDNYLLVKEAYEFLCDEIAKGGVSAPKVMGTTSTRSNNARFNRTPSKAEHEAWEKKYKKRQQLKQAEFAQKAEEVAKQNEKSEADYKRAMEAIDALRAARALEAWISAYDKSNNIKPLEN